MTLPLWVATVRCMNGAALPGGRRRILGGGMTDLPAARSRAHRGARCDPSPARSGRGWHDAARSRRPGPSARLDRVPCSRRPRPRRTPLARAPNWGRRLSAAGWRRMALALRRRPPLLAYAGSLACTGAYLPRRSPGPILIAPFLGLVALLGRDEITANLDRFGRGWCRLLSVVHGAVNGWTWPVAVFAGVWLCVAAAAAAVLDARRRLLRESQARAAWTSAAAKRRPGGAPSKNDCGSPARCTT